MSTASPSPAPETRARGRAVVLAVLLVGLLASVVAMRDGWLATARPAGPHLRLDATVSMSDQPAHFWRTAGQARAIADRQPAVRALLARYGADHVRVSVFPGLDGVPTLGVWSVLYRAPDARIGIVATGGVQLVRIADRSGTVVENSAQGWAVPWTVGASDPTFRSRTEVIAALLAAVLLVLMWDLRRLWAVRNLDLCALLSLGLSLVLFDHGHVLSSVPLQYPPLLYLAGRLIWAGLRGRAGADGEPAAWADTRILWAALAALVLARVADNLLLSATGDVSFASVVGADAIRHGWPLYTPGSGHLDAYGPAMYLSYVPFESLFPDTSWLWNWLPAAHAATIAFDVLTTAGLLLLGRRLRPGTAGTRLGLVLALGWAANPWTMQPVFMNSNDGVVALIVVALLLVASHPWLRGTVLGWGVAAKFAPLALAGLFLFATDRVRTRRAAIAFALALTVTTVTVIWSFLPPAGFGLFWAKTVGFQLDRHSFMSIWDQYPQLDPLRTLLQGATVLFGAGLLVWPRRRELSQVAALCGAVIVLLELTLRFWSYSYTAWYMPAALVGLLAVPRLGERSAAAAAPTLADELPLPGPTLGLAA